MTSEAIEKIVAEVVESVVAGSRLRHDAYAKAILRDIASRVASRVLEEAAQAWISVEKRLPVVHEDVWVWVEFHNYEGRWADSWLEEDGTWAMGSAQDYTVTHWMPLPAPPRCADCDEAAKHAYSDATTPGFFDPNCKKHRKSKPSLSGMAQEEK